MNQFSPSDLKTILHSKRANIYYLEHCRILVNGGRVEYVTEQKNKSLYWNIPIANTTVLLLGTGTSLTQAAMRELCKAGVLVGFCGGGGTPLFAGVEIEWLTPQGEYRPTEYLQQWVSFWFDDGIRLQAAKLFQMARLKRIDQLWSRDRFGREMSFTFDSEQLRKNIDRFSAAVDSASTTQDLLVEEARLTKQLYKLCVDATAYGSFTRSKRGVGSDPANRFLDHGNYLAYGLGATAAWVLGIPHSLALLHGKTRRGGLVFDIADLVKDAVILPLAFVSAVRGDDDQEFSNACIEHLVQTDSLDFMIDTIKDVIATYGQAKS